MSSGTAILAAPEGVKLNQHFRPELSPAKLQGVAKWTHRQIPPTAPTTSSDTMHTSPKPSKTTPNSTHRAVATGCSQDTHINCTALQVAQYLLNQLPLESSVLTIENSAIAQAIGRSVRTVQDALERLSRGGLVKREQLNVDNQFSLRQTTLNIPKIRRALAANQAILSAAPKRRRAKKKAKAAPAAVRYPFAQLKEPARFEAAYASLASELQAGHQYWQILSKYASSPSAPLSIKISSQRRRISDGDRGAPMWARQMLASDLSAIDAYVTQRAGVGEEVAFQVVGAEHRLLLIDDVPKSLLDALPPQAIVLETSPETFQVTLIAPRALNKDDRKAAQRALVWQFQGDPGALASNQLRRLPGSINNKSELSEAFVTRIFRLPNDSNAVLSDSETDKLILDGQRPADSRKQAKPTADATAHALAASESTAVKVLDNSESVKEFRWALNQLRQGADQDKLRVELAKKAHARGKRSSYVEALEYASITVFNAARYAQRWRANRTSARPSAS